MGILKVKILFIDETESREEIETFSDLTFNPQLNNKYTQLSLVHRIIKNQYDD